MYMYMYMCTSLATHKALRGIVHEVELEPVLLPVALGQGMAENVWRNGRLLTVLKLSEQVLRGRGVKGEGEREGEGG
jgi:hypothetical protein